MGSKWVWVLMFVSLAWCLSQACFDEERVALLQLKHFFNLSRYNDLSNWVDGEKNSDCCQWGTTIECSNSTGRVISLNLWSTRNENSGEWYLNASLFSVFEELESLELSENNIAGFVKHEGLDKLSRLSKLEYLVLDHNMFNNDILSSLLALSSLKELHLSDNKLKGTIDLQGIKEDLCIEQGKITIFVNSRSQSIKHLNVAQNLCHAIRKLVETRKQIIEEKRKKSKQEAADFQKKNKVAVQIFGSKNKGAVIKKQIAVFSQKKIGNCSNIKREIAAIQREEKRRKIRPAEQKKKDSSSDGRKKISARRQTDFSSQVPKE